MNGPSSKETPDAHKTGGVVEHAQHVGEQHGGLFGIVHLGAKMYTIILYRRSGDALIRSRKQVRNRIKDRCRCRLERANITSLNERRSGAS